MKKRIILGLVLFFALCSVKGQERRLITIEGDTIFVNRRPSRPQNPWVIGIQSGGSYLTGSTANVENDLQSIGVSKEQAKNYSNQLRNGFHISANVHFLMREYWGFGLKYSFFTTSAHATFNIRGGDYPPEFFTVGMKEWQYINYEGPSILAKQWLDRQRKFRMTGELSAVFVHYRDEVRFDRDQFVLRPPSALAKGHSWGGNFVLSLDYYLRPRFSVGVNAGYFYSVIKKIHVITRETNQVVELMPRDYIDVSRLDYSLGMRYHF